MAQSHLFKMIVTFTVMIAVGLVLLVAADLFDQQAPIAQEASAVVEE